MCTVFNSHCSQRGRKLTLYWQQKLKSSQQGLGRRAPLRGPTDVLGISCVLNKLQYKSRGTSSSTLVISIDANGQREIQTFSVKRKNFVQITD